MFWKRFLQTLLKSSQRFSEGSATRSSNLLNDFRKVLWNGIKTLSYISSKYNIQSVAKKTLLIAKTVFLDFGFWYLSIGRESSKPIIKWNDKLGISYNFIYCMFQRIFNLNSKMVQEGIFISFTHPKCHSLVLKTKVRL